MQVEHDGWPQTSQTALASRLKRVISDLKNDSDIEGAVLIGEKDSVIASDLPSERNYIIEIPAILSQLRQWYDSTLILNGMFTHCIMDYNGCRVLAKRLRHDLTLLVMLQKQGYIGLAMLDIENSVQEIYGIIKGGVI